MFQSRSANWFDLIVAQSDLSAALEALAQIKAVELEVDSHVEQAPLDLSDLSAGLEAYGDLARRYRAYWPTIDRHCPLSSTAPADVLAHSLASTQAWAAAAAPHIDALQDAVHQESDLRHLGDIVAAAGPAFPASVFSAKPGALFAVSIHLLYEGCRPEHLPSDCIKQTFEADSGVYLLVMGPKEQIAALDDELAAIKAREIHIPELAGEDNDTVAATIGQRIETQRARQQRARVVIKQLSDHHDISWARANVERLHWLAEHVPATSNSVLFSRVTGWTSVDQAVLEDGIEGAYFDFALSVGPPPEGLNPPVVLDNPSWVKPFEVFVRLLGMPTRGEADPSLLVALIAPLLFGFMFGDVGQGAVLLITGLVLRGRWPTAAILVPGGLFAMVFGLAFGSVFAREDVISALWLHPLNEPIPVLSVALTAGVAILLSGLALNGVGAHWQGQGRRWWGRDMGLVVAYAGVLLSIGFDWGLGLSGLGAVWFLVGATVTSGRASGFGVAFAGLIENLFQLLINTVSFVRVGAFAIAHAGLSSALVVLADSAGAGVWFWGIMIAGNVFIIGLEGLVTGIQTTRLMLFEFFIRFLRAEGRALRALQTPAAWSLKLEGKLS